MRAFRQLGVLVLLLVSCLAPAMACMAPEAQMSAQEHTCCRMMKNQCGQMEMKASPQLLPDNFGDRSQKRTRCEDSGHSPSSSCTSSG